jgi:hypothetical protein
MASTDLVFQAAPLTRGDLVFGDDGSNPISDAVVSGDILLDKPTLSGSVALGVVMGGEISLVRPTLTGEVVYFTDTSRPLVGQVKSRWQHGVGQPETIAQRFQDATRRRSEMASRFQPGAPLAVGRRFNWQDAILTPNSARTRFQDGVALQRAQSQRFQDALRLRTAAVSRFQDGIPVGRAVLARYQDATRTPNSAKTRYQDARPLPVNASTGNANSLPFELGWASRYQDARTPRPGRTVVPVVPPVDPCYVPSGDLVFEAPWSADTNLVFYCEHHDVDPPEPGETIVVPVRRVYTVINTATLRRVDDGTLIVAHAMGLTIDVESWTWSFTARAAGASLPLLQPTGGQPVEVEATINGVAYRAIVEGIRRDRTYANAELSITGRGKSALLDAPYSPVMTFGADQDLSLQQLANRVLTINGVPLGWDLDAGWRPDNWIIPAGTFSHQGTYMSAITAIAAAAGAYVQPHPTAKALQVLKRYPAKPWEWNGLTPDYELPADVVQQEGIEWVDKPLYNRVFVRRAQGPGLWDVRRDGTAGDIEAPMITNALMTNAVGAEQAALAVLADVGRQAVVSLRLPVLPETGIIPPGKFVRYVDGDVTRVGLVRSTAADVERSRERGLQIWQTIGVETHV